MIRDLDLTLKSLLSGEAEPGSELGKADISFSVPDEEWQKKGNKLELNVYLYDIRENRELRTNEMQLQRNPEGRIIQQQPPPRIDCAYLITAWNKATADSEDRELQEHRLLAQVLYVLLRNPTIPPDYLQGLLQSQEPALPMVTAQRGHLNDPVEFWNTLNTPARPSISCIVTISLDLDRWREAAMVISRITDYQQYGQPQTRKTSIQIGGQVTDAAEPSRGIDGAVVMIGELSKKTVTDSSGYYTFSQLPSGTFTLQVSAPGFKEKTAAVEVPPPDDQNYDIKLSK
jgi:hypothetical protein